MAIVRKPERSAQAAVDVESLINRGGSPASAPAPVVPPPVAPPSFGPITLRIPPDMLKCVDIVKGKVSRDVWILEAIHEKLIRAVPKK